MACQKHVFTLFARAKMTLSAFAVLTFTAVRIFAQSESQPASQPGVAPVSQSGSFSIQSAGRVVGKASFTLAPAKHGLRLTSHYTYRLGATDGDFTDDFKFEPTLAYTEGTTRDNAADRQLSFVPNKARTELAAGSFKGGAEPTTFVPVSANLVILPNYDPGAAQALLLLATTHPTPDNKYNVFLPAIGPPSDPDSGLAQGRSAKPSAADPASVPAADDLPPFNRAYDALWIKGRLLTGTLDAKPVTVRTFILAFGKARWIFFADDRNQLLQLSVSALKASYIRTGFKLDPIPPASTAARVPNPPAPTP